MLMKYDRLIIFQEVTESSRSACLTFVDDFEVDLSITSVHIWTVTHLADEGTIEGRRHLMQGDGGVPFRYISRPHRMVFKTPLSGRIWALMVVKHLRHKYSKEWENPNYSDTQKHICLKNTQRYQ